MIGSTAVEDRLQEQVPSTIRELLKAGIFFNIFFFFISNLLFQGIKICMLTGDKLETAENIAKSCNLITPAMKVFTFRLNPQSLLEKNREIREKLQDFIERSAICTLNKLQKALLIEGEALTYIIREREHRKLYVKLINDFEAVVCCRVTPKQKADVVSLVKTYLNKTTLSIGDGANDVNMIQEADIG